MRLCEFDISSKSVVDGVTFYVVSVIEHKTGKSHGPARIIFRHPMVYQLLKTYINDFRPTPADNESAPYV